jgi:hypothetical protein
MTGVLSSIFVPFGEDEGEFDLRVRRGREGQVMDHGCRDEVSVLVLVREQLEIGQGMELRPVYPLVRLRLLDDCPMRLRHAGDFRWRQDLTRMAEQPQEPKQKDAQRLGDPRTERGGSSGCLQEESSRPGGEPNA